MAVTNRSFMGKGSIYIQLKEAGAALLPVGNASALNLSFEEEKQDQPDHQNPGGGVANSVSRISAFNGSMTALSFSADNMAKAFRGSVTAEATGAVTDEPHAMQGVDQELIPFDFIADKTQTITVKGAGGTPTYTEGTDYTLGNNGIKVIGTGTMTQETVQIDYTKAASEIMQALVAGSQEFKIVFDGLNEAESGKAVSVTLHRVKFSPAAGLDLIGEEFGEMAMDFTVLSDETVQGAGASKYMQIAFQD